MSCSGNVKSHPSFQYAPTFWFSPLITRISEYNAAIVRSCRTWSIQMPACWLTVLVCLQLLSWALQTIFYSSTFGFFAKYLTFNKQLHAYLYWVKKRTIEFRLQIIYLFFLLNHKSFFCIIKQKSISIIAIKKRQYFSIIQKTIDSQIFTKTAARMNE